MYIRLIALVLAVTFMVAVPEAWARNTIHQYSIREVMEKPENASRLKGVSFYFGEEAHPRIKADYGEFRTNKKTNAFNKSDLEACQWVMMSALLQLHQRALSMGANAVVNVKSNYKDVEVSSETEYTCGAGTTVAGVALIGTVVVLD
jgi:uncharacterized membrane protein